MPFIAISEGETVTPEEVPKSEMVRCPYCAADMVIRERHKRDGSFVARHFVHKEGSDLCPGGGESERHKRLKSIVLSKFKHSFPYQEAGIERKIGNHIADVYLEFLDLGRHQYQFGDGFVAEVQYRNSGKNKLETLRDYISHDYSVYWVTESDFEGKDVELRELHRHWWDENYSPDVLTVYEALEHLYRVQGQSWRSISFSDVEEESGIDLDRTVGICKFLSAAGALDLYKRGGIKPKINTRYVDQSPGVREKLKTAMKLLKEWDTRPSGKG